MYGEPAEGHMMLLPSIAGAPGRPIIAVANGEFAALEPLHGLRAPMAVIVRLRKDVGLFDPPPRQTGKPGRVP